MCLVKKRKDTPGRRGFVGSKSSCSGYRRFSSAVVLDSASECEDMGAPFLAPWHLITNSRELREHLQGSRWTLRAE